MKKTYTDDQPQELLKQYPHVNTILLKETNVIEEFAAVKDETLIVMAHVGLMDMNADEKGKLTLISCNPDVIEANKHKVNCIKVDREMVDISFKYVGTMDQIAKKIRVFTRAYDGRVTLYFDPKTL